MDWAGQDYMRGGAGNMKSKVKIIIVGVSLIVGVAVFMLVQLPALAADEESQQGLQLPDDLTMEKDRKFQYQEHRVGGRLESVTVTRKNGFNETYRNIRPDTIWAAEENEIGDVQNTRQWTIGTW